MRRLSLTAAAIVSTAVLLTTTSVLAIAPAKINLGTLKSQGSWKVGTVDQGSERYCAMVGSYDGKVVAAFARNPQGLGSLALDFGGTMFTPGKAYDVSLAADGIAPHTFKARASTERSLVIQIGEDGSFYDALSKNGTLGVDMSAASLRLDLAKFSDSHKDLVECAGQLTTDEQSAEPKQRTAELPIDRELAELSQARTNLAAASTKADDIQKTMESKAGSLDALEAQLEAEARSEIERSKTNIASIDNKQQAVREKLAAKGVAATTNPLDLSMVEPAAGTPELPVPAVVPSANSGSSAGRKLLAAMGGGNAGLTVPPSTGSSSRDIEARELGLADSGRAAAETAKALELKNEIAAIEAEKNAQAQKTLAAFDTRQQELDAKGSKLAEQRDNTLAKLSSAAAAEEQGRKLRADVIAKQAGIAEVKDEKKKEAQELPRQLAATQSAFESRIATLEAERNQLRDQVSSVVAENERLKKSTASGKPEDRLEIAQLKKQLLEMETQRQAEVARAAAAQKELDGARQQIASLRQGSQDEMARLANVQRSLEAERSQLNAERGAVARASSDAAAKAGSEVEAMRQSLAQKQAELDAVSTASTAAASQAGHDLDVMRQALAKKQTELETVALEQGAEAKRLQGEKDSIEAARSELEKEKSGAAVLASSQRLMETERAELNTLRDRIKTLESDLAGARAQAAMASAAVAAAPKPVAEGTTSVEKAEMSRLQEENASLRERLAGLLSGRAREKTAEAAVPVINEVAPKAVDSVATTTTETPEVSTVRAAQAESSTPSVAASASQDTAPAVSGKKQAQAQAQAQAQGSADAGSPVLASLFGKRGGDVPSVTPAVDARALNAAEPAAGGNDLSPLPGNDKRMPAIPAVQVEKEIVAAPVTQQAETKVQDTVRETAQVEPVTANVTAGDAEIEIARMAPITASVPATRTVREIPVSQVAVRKADNQPAAPQQDKGIFGIFSRSLGYKATGAKTAQDAEASVAALQEPQIPQEAIIRVTRPAAGGQQAEAQPQAGEITAADTNRAAAFLDNIMAFHRPQGSDATGPSVTASSRRAVVPVAQTDDLNAIETAAGGPSLAVAAQPRVAQPQTQVLAAAPSPVQSPVQARPQAQASAIGLDAVLRQAGLGNVTVTSAGADNAQWSTGAMNGMYERQGAQADFDRQVDGYLARYQDDCPGKLNVAKGAIQPTVSGSLRVVDITCAMPENGYATSIVFTRSMEDFGALLHAGQAGDSAEVRRVGAAVAGVLRNAGTVVTAAVSTGSVVPASYAQMPAAAQPVQRPRLRVEIQAPSAVPESAYDLPTTIIE